MIENLYEYFKPELDIFLDSVNYNRIESAGNEHNKELSLLCQENIKVSVNDKGVRIIVSRSLLFEPERFFVLNVSLGADLKFNERKNEHKWEDINLAEEFKENGAFVTGQLMSRISLLIGQITSSFGQAPLIIPAILAKNDNNQNN